MARRSLIAALATVLCLALVPGQASGQTTVATSLRIWKSASVGPGGPVYKVLVFGKLSSTNPGCMKDKSIQVTAGKHVITDVTDGEGEFLIGFRARHALSAVAKFLGTTATSYNATYAGAVSCGASTSNTVNVKPPNANNS